MSRPGPGQGGQRNINTKARAASGREGGVPCRPRTEEDRGTPRVQPDNGHVPRRPFFVAFLSPLAILAWAATPGHKAAEQGTMQLLSSGACSEPRGRGSHTAHSVLFPTVLPRPQTRDPAPHTNVSLRMGCCSQMGVFLYPWPAHQSSADHNPGTEALPPSPSPARDRSGTKALRCLSSAFPDQSSDRALTVWRPRAEQTDWGCGGGGLSPSKPHCQLAV